MIQSLFATILMTIGFTAHSANLLNCLVPESPDINFITLELGDEPSRDYLTITLMQVDMEKDLKSFDEIPTSYLFTISEKGSFQKQMNSGVISTLVFTEQVGKSGSVLVNAGFLNIQKSDDGKSYAGFMAIMNNVYFMICAPPANQ